MDVLDAAAPASLISEGDGVMPYEVACFIDRTCQELDDMIESASTDEEILNSDLSRFIHNKDPAQILGEKRAWKKERKRQRECAS